MKKPTTKQYEAQPADDDVERAHDAARAKLGLPLAHRHTFTDGKPCECGHPDAETLKRRK